MPAAAARHGTAGLAGLGPLLLLALVTAPQARASSIYACVSRHGGAVHLVPKAARCRKGESKESWNTRGRAGATGAVSANGAAGLNGFNGVTGANGPAGPTTETGAPGAAGARGSAGPPGGTGETGATGVAGTKGATGAQGPTAVTGETGATGVAGTNGVTGAQGPTGATGETGAVGPTGAGGAVGGYSASNAAAVNFTTKSGNPTSILIKEGIPAGSFIVYSKLVVTASDTEPGAAWLAECTVTDKPSTGATTEDTAAATGVIVADHTLDESATTLSLGMGVTTTAISKLTLACSNVSNSSTTGGFTLRGTYAAITAVQTTQNS
jgi:hypothetical protein